MQGDTISCRIEDIDPTYEQWQAMNIPEFCQQFGCTAEVETFCPLCRSVFCAEHDPLWPVRRHDCLRGKAEAA